MNSGCAVGIVAVLGAVALVIILYLIGGFAFMLAWNVVMPQVFGLIQISWVQGVALVYMIGHFAGWTAKTNSAISEGVKRASH